MQALTLPAGRGWRWLYEGFQIFRKSPLMLSLILLSYWMLMATVGSLPVLGQLLMTLLIPTFSVGLMNACRTIEQGARFSPPLMLAGVRENLRTLLLLGVVYIIVSSGILGLTALVDDGVLFGFIVHGRAPNEQAHASGAYPAAAQLALVLFTPLMITYWFAPVLAAWHRVLVGKSLFFSLVACLRNWRAFLVYGAAVVVFAAIAPGLLLAILISIFSDGSGLAVTLLTFLVVLIVAPTLYASFYVSYRDIFVRIDDNA